MVVVPALTGDAELVGEANRPAAEVARFFRLDWDARAAAAEVARRGPELAPLLDRLTGLRILRRREPEEVLLSFLCTANNHLPRIRSMVRHLEAYAETPGGFPSAERVAAIDPADLWAAGFGYRSRTVPGCARAVAERGPGWLASLAEAPYREAWRELRGLPWMGPKLADCTALFGLGFSEAVPIDVHIWRALTRRYHPDWVDQALTERRYEWAAEAFRDRFGELAGWAHQVLFTESLDLGRGAPKATAKPRS